MTFFEIVGGIALIILLTIPYFARLLDKAQTKRCERWKKEQMEAGMSEEDADHFLFADPDFIL